MVDCQTDATAAVAVAVAYVLSVLDLKVFYLLTVL